MQRQVLRAPLLQWREWRGQPKRLARLRSKQTLRAGQQARHPLWSQHMQKNWTCQWRR